MATFSFTVPWNDEGRILHNFYLLDDLLEIAVFNLENAVHHDVHNLPLQSKNVTQSSTEDSSHSLQ